MGAGERSGEREKKRRRREGEKKKKREGGEKVEERHHGCEALEAHENEEARPACQAKSHLYHHKERLGRPLEKNQRKNAGRHVQRGKVPHVSPFRTYFRGTE